MKLPSVYANKIDKVIKNNDDFYRSDIKDKRKDVRDLRKYFDHNGYANKFNVVIKSVDGTREERLILYKDDYFVNINNKRIYFKDIIDYEIKK